MKYFMKSFGVFAMIIAMTFQAKAQYGAVSAGSCPYQMNMGDEVTSKQDDLRELQQELKDLKADLRDAQSDVKDAQNAVSSAQKMFELRGLKSEYAQIIEAHISDGKNCNEYSGYNQVGGAANAQVPPPQATADNSSAPNYGGGDPTDYTNAVRKGHGQKPVPKTFGNTTGDYFSDFNRKGQTSEEKPTQGSSSNQEVAVQDRMPASDVPTETGKPDVSNPASNGVDMSPFQPGEFSRWCVPQKAGEVYPGVCNIQSAKVEHGWDIKSCTSSLKNLKDANARLRKAQHEQERLEAEVEGKKYEINVMKQDVKLAIRERQREMREEMSEGGCVDCYLQGTYSRQTGGNGNSTGAILTNLGLGALSMYFGNQMQKSIATDNARLGFPTQPIPSFGFGYPFIMAGVAAAMGGGGGGGYYGAVGSGMGGGAFGCASTGGSQGFYGQGGAMGYPNGYYGMPMAGGMYMPGMGSWGMNGPMGGINGMFPGGLMGGLQGMMMGGYGGMMMSGGIMMNGGMMMGGYPMGGMTGMMMSGGIMMPGGGMMMGGYPMGGMTGMMMSGGIMMPGGMMMGGYPMMGGMGGVMVSGGMMMPGGMMMGGYPMMGGMGGIMASGGIMMPGMMGGGMMGYPMGGMGAMGMMGMGLDSSGMQMQLAQQQMQMQMQQQQMYMQMQQRASENYMARYQTVVGLSSEMQGLMMRLQQAQMSLQYGGYTDISLGVGSGTAYYGTGSLTQPIYSTPIYNNPYGTTTPIYNNGLGTSTGSASVR